MSQIRRIRKVLRARPTIEGAGVHLKRVFGFSHVPQLDPFLLLDDFHAAEPSRYLPGFPWHPHRGIETITYVLRGEVEHGDSLGNEGLIGPGDVQWMTAGSGIVHQEMPRGDREGVLWGLQLWANLPAAQKMTPPRYRDIRRDQIPEVTLGEGARARVICGELEGVRGPVEGVAIAPELLDVEIPSGGRFTRSTPPGHRVFAYALAGTGYFEPERDPYAYEVEGRPYFDFRRDCRIGPEQGVIFEPGAQVLIEADEPLRFLLVSGRPLEEPIAWHGPIVMNTRAELKLAFDEYERGTFLKHGKQAE